VRFGALSLYGSEFTANFSRRVWRLVLVALDRDGLPFPGR